MQYDFTTIWDRHGKDAIAVEAIGNGDPSSPAPGAPKDGFSAIPMWVADMNFATAPSITQAMEERIRHPLFGYFSPSDDYFDSIIRWHTDRNHVSGLSREHIGYENGVLGCVCSALLAFTAPGDKVLVHSPTYIGFLHALSDTGRTPELSPLVRDEEGIWRMDYEDMDRRLKQHHIHFAILCNPHNPCGRAWEAWEIEKAMEIYRENECVVVSDEIWSDILLNGHHHTPAQSVSEDARNRTIAVYAPSKTFNLAGLIGSYHIIYSQYLRDRLNRMADVCYYNSMNVLSMHALIGAYKAEGAEWLGQLNETLSRNINYAYAYITEHFKGISTFKPEGTYMMFLHCEDYCRSRSLTIQDLLRRGWDVGVGWQSGVPFQDPWGIRMNFALPFSLVEEAMDRLNKYVFSE